MGATASLTSKRCHAILVPLRAMAARRRNDGHNTSNADADIFDACVSPGVVMTESLQDQGTMEE